MAVQTEEAVIVDLCASLCHTVAELLALQLIQQSLSLASMHELI